MLPLFNIVHIGFWLCLVLIYYIEQREWEKGSSNMDREACVYMCAHVE